MIAILILAAGQSTRMRGVDKLSEVIDGVPLLRLQALRALATGAEVFVTLPAADHPRMGFINDLDVTPIIVAGAADGIGVSLRDGVLALPPCDAFLVMLADLVAIETTDLQKVIAARDSFPDHDIWRGAAEAGTLGHPILFDAHLRPAFATLKGDQGGAAILKDPKLRIHPVPLEGDRALLDLDTPEDWAAWRSGKSVSQE